MGLAVSQLPKCVTNAEAGRQLGVGWRAVNQMVADGDLKTMPIPGKVRATILQSSIDELIARLKASVQQAG